MNGAVFGLIETMRCDGGIALLERHLRRVTASARFFGVPLNEERIRAAITRTTDGIDPRTPARIRLLVGRDGIPSLTVTPLTSMDGNLLVAFSTKRVDAADQYLYHKTTHRSVYDSEWMAAQEAGLFEVLFMNEQGVVAEGSRSNLFARIGQDMLTPPLDSGLLPGVYRSLVLDSFPNARESRLSESDVRSADRLYVCNAVIGLRQVRLIDSFLPISRTRA